MLKQLLKISLVLALAIIFSDSAFAQTRRRRTTTPDPYSTTTETPSSSSSTYVSSGSSSSSGHAGRMAASGALGFYGNNGAAITANNTSAGMASLSGLFGLGGDFDYFMSDDMSIGGVFRYYSTADTGGNTEFTDTAMTLGATVKAYIFDTTNWNGSLTTGLGMVTAQYKQGNTSFDSGTAFGFYMGATLLYKMSRDLGIGIENLRMIAMGSSLNGWPISDFMFKARFMF